MTDEINTLTEIRRAYKRAMVNASYFEMLECQKAIKALEDAESALRDRIARQNPQLLTGWISVGDRLPETSGEYQCYCNGKSRIAKFKTDKSGMCYWDIISNECYTVLWRVTHWMPLPEPPEREARD